MKSKKAEKMEKQLEKTEEEKRRKAELFDIDEAVEDSEQVKTAYIPELNRTIEYCSLTIGDLTEIREGKNDEERGKRILWKMLSKANPKVTWEKVNQLKLEIAVPIINRLVAPLGKLRNYQK